MKASRKVFLFVIFAAITGGGLVAWSLVGRNPQENQEPKTVRVERRDFASTVLATGEVDPQVGAEVKVGARISGKVDRLLANIGDQVRKGEVIARIEQEDLKAQVEQREAELQRAEAQLSAVENLRPKEIEKAQADVQRWEATLHQARRHLERQNELITQEFTSEEAVDKAEEQVGVAGAQLAAARKALELARTRYEEDLKQAGAEVARARAALRNAEVQLSYATIQAPISGVIGTVTTQEGETVAAGLNAPTFVEIIDLERLEVDAYVDEVDIGKVKAGQTAEFTVDAFPDRTFEGEVRAIYPDAVIRENVVYYDVVIDIEGDYAGLLRPKMTTNVTIFLESREDVLALPSKAVHRSRGLNVVYLPGDGEIRRQEVKVGWRDDGWVEIVGGLREGQEVLPEPPQSQSSDE
ncbi:MAG: efflux RND transporter periplasmic adaptor subunit [Candidatus Brocadiia bacterium]